MEIIVTEELRRILNVASTDAGRDAIRNVHFRNGKATTTNGFCLAQTDVECTDIPEESLDTPVLVPADVVKDVKILKKGTNALLIVRDKEVEIIDSKPNRVHKVDLNGTTFPDIDRVLNNSPAEYRCLFTVEHLMEVCKCFSKEDIIEFQFTTLKKTALDKGCNDPIRFKNKDGKVTGLIMPALAWQDE